MKDKELEEIKGRHRAATGEGWEDRDGFYPSMRDLVIGGMTLSYCVSATDLSFDEGWQRQRNATLAAHSYADISRLIAALEAERKEVERLRTLIGEAFETMNHAETFVASREKMHPPGQELYREGLEDLSATKEHGIEEGT